MPTQCIQRNPNLLLAVAILSGAALGFAFLAHAGRQPDRVIRSESPKSLLIVMSFDRQEYAGGKHYQFSRYFNRAMAGEYLLKSSKEFVADRRLQEKVDVYPQVLTIDDFALRSLPKLKGLMRKYSSVTIAAYSGRFEMNRVRLGYEASGEITVQAWLLSGGVRQIYTGRATAEYETMWSVNDKSDQEDTGEQVAGKMKKVLANHKKIFKTFNIPEPTQNPYAQTCSLVFFLKERIPGYRITLCTEQVGGQDDGCIFSNQAGHDWMQAPLEILSLAPVALKGPFKQLMSEYLLSLDNDKYFESFFTKEGRFATRDFSNASEEEVIAEIAASLRAPKQL